MVDMVGVSWEGFAVAGSWRVLWIGVAAGSILAYRAHASHRHAHSPRFKGYTGCQA
ncbi:hypothetical protein [Roseateles chitinivorans]|jgi:hypothetical protein|uniref:hypothetical protein n=1 Tax=Roseateles chitinivorans TaxID=2917965 RepID=UPI0013044EAC|nr:hypothetical protein [Roseateles chitinivorans]